MKKLFIVLAVVSLGFVACNNEGSGDATLDSAANKVEEKVEAAKDSLNVIKDSAAAKLDSLGNAVKDSLTK